MMAQPPQGQPMQPPQGMAYQYMAPPMGAAQGPMFQAQPFQAPGSMGAMGPAGPAGMPGMPGQMPHPYAAYGPFPGQPPYEAAASMGSMGGMGQASSDSHAEGGCGCGGAGHSQDAKHLENKYGQLYGMINEAASGNPDISKFMNFFSSTSSDFWKGALVGAGLTLLLTNDTIKGAIAGSVSSVWGAFSKKAEEMEEEEDRKAEERFAKEAK